MKQTAVQLLKQKLLNDQQKFPIYNEYINGILYDIDNQLLEMEKQQIIDAFKRGTINEMNGIEEINSEQYYNETFNK